MSIKKTVAEIMELVKKAAEGAPLGTGTTVKFSQVGGTFILLPNDTPGKVMCDPMGAKLGPSRKNRYVLLI